MVLVSNFLLKELLSMTRGDWLACAGIALVVSVCGVVGYSYAAGMGWSRFSVPQLVALSVLFMFAAMALLVLLTIGMRRLGRARVEGQPCAPARSGKTHRDVLCRLTPSWSKRSIALFALVMLVLWLPWTLTMIPTGMNNDTFYQIYQVFPEHHPILLVPFLGVENNVELDAWLVDHHPVLTTLLFGAFGFASERLTGDWVAGLLVYSVLQSIAYAFVYTAAIAYLRRAGCPLVVVFGLYLFYCIMPFIPAWAFSMVKDSVFGLFVIPYFMMLFETFRTQGAFLAKRSHVIWFIIAAVLVCLTRKQGMLIVVPTALIAAVVFLLRSRAAAMSTMMPSANDGADEGGCGSYRSAFRGFLAQGLVCLVLMALVLPLIVFPLANIHSGGRQEVLGVLFQQTARYLVDHPDDVEPWEREAIEGVSDYEQMGEKYLFDTQDKVKWLFDHESTSEDISRYLVAYASMGLRHPDSYFGAIMGIAGYYFAPTTYIFWQANEPVYEYEDEVFVPRAGFLSDYAYQMDHAYLSIAGIYGLNTPLLMVLYCLWIPAGMLYAIMRLRLRCKTLIVPFAIIVVTFFLVAPVYDSRYIVVSFEIAPLLFGYVVAIIRKTRYDRALDASASEAPSATLEATEVLTQHA